MINYLVLLCALSSVLVQASQQSAAQVDLEAAIHNGDISGIQKQFDNFASDLNPSRALLVAASHIREESPAVVDTLLRLGRPKKNFTIDLPDTFGETPLLLTLDLPRPAPAQKRAPLVKIQPKAIPKPGRSQEQLRAEVAKKLVDNKAQVNVANKNGITPLMKALQGWADFELVGKLVSRGAMIDAADNNGKTPLMYLALRTERYRDSRIEHLIIGIEKGKDERINKSDKQGLTPVMYAVAGLNLDNLRALVENGASIEGFSQHGKDMNAVYRTLISKQIQAPALSSHGLKEVEINDRIKKIDEFVQEYIRQQRKNMTAVLSENMQTNHNIPNLICDYVFEAQGGPAQESGGSDGATAKKDESK